MASHCSGAVGKSKKPTDEGNSSQRYRRVANYWTNMQQTFTAQLDALLLDTKLWYELAALDTFYVFEWNAFEYSGSLREKGGGIIFNVLVALILQPLQLCAVYCAAVCVMPFVYFIMRTLYTIPQNGASECLRTAFKLSHCFSRLECRSYLAIMQSRPSTRNTSCFNTFLFEHEQI